MADTRYLCIHCHYYQPPRGNPFDDTPLVEPDAAPYQNWNERVNAECYTPNADLGNFKGISFNLGETLAAWLEENAPTTYRKILHADSEQLTIHGVGSAIAQGMHHTILPLSRYQDKVTQVKWGKRVFEHRFGRKPQGMWLPEMAVDLETLEVLADHGIEWTVLAAGQVEDQRRSGGPFWVDLANGKRIKVFVRDEPLSNDLAFNLGRSGGAGHWSREVLAPYRRHARDLTLIASDGETFGHHWRGEEQFLHWLINYEALSAGFEIITLGEYASKVTPERAVNIHEYTSWSCGHGVARWSTGCGCTPGESHWKGALRRALDNLKFELDGQYFEFVGRLPDVDPYNLRNGYIEVVLGKLNESDYLKSQGISLPEPDSTALLKLVRAQYYRQTMYSSCAFFFAELDAHSTIYGIANAAYAIKLTQEATGTDTSPNFRADLKVANQADIKTGQPIRGVELYDQVVEHLGHN